jgi:3-oxoacyl-[acyl-carrier-protein] synthase-3
VDHDPYGIKERRIAAKTEATSDLAVKAAQDALSHAGIEAKDLGLLIVATITPDMQFPSVACIVQDQIGAKNAICFDISAACAGFVYAITVAQQFIAAAPANTPWSSERKSLPRSRTGATATPVSCSGTARERQ